MSTRLEQRVFSLVAILGFVTAHWLPNELAFLPIHQLIAGSSLPFISSKLHAKNKPFSKMCGILFIGFCWHFPDGTSIASLWFVPKGALRHRENGLLQKLFILASFSLTSSTAALFGAVAILLTSYNPPFRHKIQVLVVVTWPFN